MLFIGALIGLAVGVVKVVAGSAIRTGLGAVALGSRVGYSAYLNTVRAAVLLGKGFASTGGGSLGGGGASGAWSSNTTDSNDVDNQLPYEPIYQTSLDEGVEIIDRRPWDGVPILTLDALPNTSPSITNAPISILNTKSLTHNVLQKSAKNSTILRSMPTTANILTRTIRNAASNSPDAPIYTWKDVTSAYVREFNTQNEEYYLLRNRNGTYTYVQKTWDEKFNYFNNLTQTWEQFKPIGYKTYAEQIQTLKNIAAATGVFGEKYQSVLETIGYSMLALSTGGPLAKTFLNLSLEFVNQISLSKGNLSQLDYVDFIIETLPTDKLPGGDLAKDIVKDILKILVNMQADGKLKIEKNSDKLTEGTIQLILSTIIRKYRLSLFANFNNITEMEIVKVVTKMIEIVFGVATGTIFDTNG